MVQESVKLQVVCSKLAVIHSFIDGELTEQGTKDTM